MSHKSSEVLVQKQNYIVVQICTLVALSNRWDHEITDFHQERRNDRTVRFTRKLPQHPAAMVLHWILSHTRGSQLCGWSLVINKETPKTGQCIRVSR
jgi:hypothetical protein